MARGRKHTAEQIVNLLRQSSVKRIAEWRFMFLSSGYQTIPVLCQQFLRTSAIEDRTRWLGGQSSREFDPRRFIGEYKGFGVNRTVQKPDVAPSNFPAIAFVDVSDDVPPWG